MDEAQEKEIKAKVEETLKNFFGKVGLGDAPDPDTIVKQTGQHNMKRLVEEFQESSLDRRGWSDLWKNRMFADTHNHIEALRHRELMMLDDTRKHIKNVDSRNLLHLPTHDFAFNRTWTFIDEVASLFPSLLASLQSKTGLQQDVVADLLVKVLPDAIARVLKTAAETTAKT